MKNKKEILISIISLITIVIIVAGVSLAFFNYTQTGTTDNTLETGNITFLYTETSSVGRGISITDALPMTDDEGKILIGEGNVFDFNISATTASNISIPYEITLEKLDESGIEGDCIRAYLTKVNGLTEEELVLDTFTNLEQTTRTNDKVEKVLYKDAIDVNENYNQDYRLRMWVTNDYGDSDIGKSFMVKVNVYADGNVGKLCAYEPGQTWNFDYTGGEQEFTVPCSGTYKLEVWGAEGGKSGNVSGEIVGGKGAHVSGEYYSLKDTSLFIVNGGKGGTSYAGWNSAGPAGVGGYNGGGSGANGYSNNYFRSAGGAGGGATHIALASGLISSVEPLIVAGGGGGAWYDAWTSSTTNGSSSSNSNGVRGKGTNAVSTQSASCYSAGGGGYYGGTYGYSGTNFIESTLINPFFEQGVNSGDGKATITLVSLN